MRALCGRRLPGMALTGMLAIMLSGCFTGVESTKRITPGRAERQMLLPQPEDTLLSCLPSVYLRHWQLGRTFVVSDARITHIMDQMGHRTLSAGDTLQYAGIEQRRMPDGRLGDVLLFGMRDRNSDTTPKAGSTLFRYPITAVMHISADTLRSSNVPLLIDLDMVDKANTILAGRKVWVRSNTRYDADGVARKSLKYVPVTITGVSAGQGDFPLRVTVRENDGKQYWLKMNSGNGYYESRSFADLFSLTDPRLRYTSVPDTTWRHIQNSDAVLGMTKEECRLALGNPDDVDAGRSHSQTLDIWQYASGITLRFADGVLVDMRK